MSSASNVTDPSSIPEENTPAFFHRAYNAYGAALTELLASPSSSPRRAGRPPDPTGVNPGPYQNVTCPPAEIEVETVYTVESSPVNPSFHDGAHPVVSGSSGHQSPISLFGQAPHDNGHLNHTPTLFPPRDAFAFASPRDPDVSLIPPNMYHHYQTPAQTDSYVHDFTIAVPSTSRENPAPPCPSSSAPPFDVNNVNWNHARQPPAFDQFQAPAQPSNHAAPPFATAPARQATFD
jgi:hypothetical protein